MHLAWISREIGRQVGVLINRRGQVEHTFVGDSKRIYLPDLGRERAGGRHLRGLRHVHTVLDASGLHTEDLADLAKLRLDAVCAINVTPAGEPGSASYAYLLPNESGEHGHCTETAHSVHAMTFDFDALITALEEERARHQVTRHVDSHRVRAIVLGLYPDRETAQWRINEIRELAATAGVVVEDTMTQLRRQIDSRFVVGRGKLEDAVLRCLDVDAQLLIIDHDLSPAQARSIAEFSDLKVIDRTQLILDIFAQHAKTRDGKLQVELAQLRYTLPRLTDLDAGLSRLTGGIGGRGPGETKLEINRRRARERISRLEHDIELISKRRAVRRERRHQGSVPIISIVGYTNAGKSTLLNALTRSEVLVADQLFATLDPASRRLRFPEEREAVVTDTVGFIQDLPPDLVQAFRATLEELESADLLLHVIDVSDPRREEKAQVVRGVLSDLGLSGIPMITVYNKADRIPQFEAMALARKADGAAISALTGQGLAPLVNRIAHRLWQTEALPENNAWALEARLAVFGPARALRPAVAG